MTQTAHLPLVSRKATLSERLDYRSEPYVKGQCQLWLGGRDKGGYGWVWFEGRNLKAHRAAWIAAHGSIPDGMQVLHTCDNPPCRNIDHLFLGTQVDNSADMVAKGRQARIGRRNPGSNNGRAKLTEFDMLEIRAMKGVSQKAIAAMYGVSQTTVCQIRRGARWTHL